MAATKKIKSKVKKNKAVKMPVKKTAGGLKMALFDLTGKETGVEDLPKEIFAVKANPKLLAQYVRVYLANQRQGNASTKTRGQVTGSTRKIYQQKGTGRARHGDIKAPIFVGGGIVGGPTPKDFSLSMSKQQRKQALFCALSSRQKDGDIVGLNDSFLKIPPKTKVFVKFLKTATLVNQSLLLIVPKMEKNNLVMAVRNVQSIHISDATNINAYETLRNKKIAIISSAIPVIKKHFLNANEN